MQSSFLNSLTCPRCGSEVSPSLVESDGTVECDACGHKFSVPGTTRPEQTFSFEESQTEKPGTPLPLLSDQSERPAPAAPLKESRSTSCFGTIWTIFSLFFVVAGIWFYVSERKVYNLLVSEGKTTLAQVTHLDVDYDDDGDTYYVTYLYKTSESGVIEETESVSRDYYNSVNVGDRVDVLYAPSNPQTVRLKGDFGPPSVMFVLVFSGMGGLFTLIGLWLTWKGLTAQDNLDEIRKNGRDAQAIITDKWTEYGSKGRTRYAIAFKFLATVEDGGQIEVAHAEYNRTAYHKLKVGDNAHVRYLPATPEICMFVDF